MLSLHQRKHIKNHKTPQTGEIVYDFQVNTVPDDDFLPLRPMRGHLQTQWGRSLVSFNVNVWDPHYTTAVSLTLWSLGDLDTILKMQF